MAKSSSTYLGLAAIGVMVANLGGGAPSSYSGDYERPKGPEARSLSIAEATADFGSMADDLTGPSFFVMDGAFKNFAAKGPLTDEQSAIRAMVTEKTERNLSVPDELGDYFRDKGYEQAKNGEITLDYAMEASKTLLDEHSNLTRASSAIVSMAKAGGVSLPRVIPVTDRVVSDRLADRNYAWADSSSVQEETAKRVAAMAKETGVRPGSVDTLSASIGTIYRSTDVISTVSKEHPEGMSEFPKERTLEARLARKADPVLSRADIIKERAAASVAAANARMVAPKTVQPKASQRDNNQER